MVNIELQLLRETYREVARVAANVELDVSIVSCELRSATREKVRLGVWVHYFVRD